MWVIWLSARLSELRDLFAQHGTVAEVFIAMDKFSGRSRGFAFVTMGSDAEAKAAITGVMERMSAVVTSRSTKPVRKKRVADAPSPAAAAGVVVRPVLRGGGGGRSSAAWWRRQSPLLSHRAFQSSRFSGEAEGFAFFFGCARQDAPSSYLCSLLRVFSLRITACATFSGRFDSRHGLLPSQQERSARSCRGTTGLPSKKRAQCDQEFHRLRYLVLKEGTGDARPEAGDLVSVSIKAGCSTERVW